MKTKTARRFVMRNEWKFVRDILLHDINPSFKKRYVKCIKVLGKAHRKELSAARKLIASSFKPV